MQMLLQGSHEYPLSGLPSIVIAIEIVNYSSEEELEEKVQAFGIRTGSHSISEIPLPLP